jgi:DNA-binding response OmpR family regulator
MAAAQVDPVAGAPTVVVVARDARPTRAILSGVRDRGLTAVQASDVHELAAVLARTGPAVAVLSASAAPRAVDEALMLLRITRPEVPVIVLTSRAGRARMLGKLRGGTDDYLITPFRIDELVDRIKLRARRDLDVSFPVLHEGGVTLNVLTGEATANGRAVGLTPTEFAVLRVLLEHAGRPVPKERISSEVWSRPVSSNIVEVYVGYLRRKLGAEHVRTVRGVGYVIST